MMSKALFTLALLASAFALPLAVHADTIDDFVLTGGGHTITFSLPASPPNVFPVLVMGGPATAGFFIGDSVTVDGQTVQGFFQFVNDFAGESAGLDVDALDNSDYYVGALLYSGSSSHPTFLTGSFSLELFDFRVFPPFIDYTLTITPEASTTGIPEPSSLALLTTGTLGLIAFAARRKKTHPLIN
jgi:hypothetical protein